MLTVSQALQHILEAALPLAPQPIALGEALGRVLATEVVSPVDSPPFDKALMDGYAVRSADVSEGVAELRVLEMVTAGALPTQPVTAGTATQIMTGAPLPEGADAVVQVEHTERDDDRVRIQTKPISPGRSILRQGTTMQRGEVLFPVGTRLRAQELAVLAELGQSEVSARPRPRVGVLATGDELVPVDQTPGPGQIRNTNETMLTAQVTQVGAEAVPLGIARDVRADLQAKILQGLQCDVLLLSGGVSAGKRDLVPSELTSAGVHPVFHKVNLKPGKPLWFGAREHGQDPFQRCLVFGLPGNPVSSMVCFDLFVRTALRCLEGSCPATPQTISARLSQEHLATGDRLTYYPAVFHQTDTGVEVTPIPWHGSADLRATTRANCYAVFEPKTEPHRPGDTIDVLVW